jgi:DNA-binding CsgD family transcriptional regulator/PAS domain-containing protein
VARADDLADLAGRMYEAAVSPDLWPDALEALAAWVGASVAHLYRLDRRSGRPLFAAANAGAPRDGLRAYHEHYQHVDPRLPGAVSVPAGALVPDWRLVPAPVFERSEFFNDFYAPLRLRWMAAAVLARDAGSVSGLSLVRGPEAGAFGRAEARRLARVLPSLRRALAVQRRLGEASGPAAPLAATLDRLPVGMIVTDGAGRPVAVNRAAEALAAEADGLALGSDGLRAATPEATAALRHAIGQAGRCPAGRDAGPDGALTLPRPSGRPPLAVLVAPLARDRVPPGLEPRGCVLVVVDDPGRRPALPAGVVAALYGLTPAEARLAVRLAEGASLEAVAEGAGPARSTLRWTLKQVLAKTGTRRQADLVRLLVQGPAALGAAGLPGRGPASPTPVGAIRT